MIGLNWVSISLLHLSWQLSIIRTKVNPSVMICSAYSRVENYILNRGSNLSVRIILNEKNFCGVWNALWKFDTTIKGLVYEEEDNIHIIYDTDRYTLPNMQDLKLVLSATRDDEQILVKPLIEAIQKYSYGLSGNERDQWPNYSGKNKPTWSAG